MRNLQLLMATLFALYTVTISTQLYTVGEGQAANKAKRERMVPTYPITDFKKLSPAQSIHREKKQSEDSPGASYPLRRIIVTSPFGMRTDPFTKKKVRHNGLDLRAHYEPAYAMFCGKVIRAGKDSRSGMYVTLRHGDLTVSYCHLSKITVAKGVFVHPGDPIGITGNSGRSSGPHLHLTVRMEGNHINPGILLQFIDKTRKQALKGLSE